jgi:N-acylneuraminate cytidylyltransferase
MLCIIPARGGSKRIPRKNIKQFLDKPIIAYAIESAIKSNLFEEVMVSTDDDEIAKIAKDYGAVVPFLRSEKNAGDMATTIDVLLEVLYEYESRGKVFSHCCCIYATSAFTTSTQLKTAYKLLEDGEATTVFPVLEFSYPIDRALREKDGFFSWRNPEYETTRSQDLEDFFHDSGQFYFCKVDSLKEENRILTKKTRGLRLSPMEAHDIDTEEDWKVAEFKYSWNKQNKK